MGCACVTPAGNDTVTSSRHGSPLHDRHGHGHGGHDHATHGIASGSGVVSGGIGNHSDGSPIMSPTSPQTSADTLHRDAAGVASVGVSFRSTNNSKGIGDTNDARQGGTRSGNNTSGSSGGKRQSDILVPGALQRPSLDTPNNGMMTNNGREGGAIDGHDDHHNDSKRPATYLAAAEASRPYSRSGVNHITSATEKGPSQSQSPVDYKVSVSPLDEKTLRDRKRGVMGGGDTRQTVTSQSSVTHPVASVSRGPTIDIDESGAPAPSSSIPPKSAAAAILAAPQQTRTSSASVTTHDRGHQKQHYQNQNQHQTHHHQQPNQHNNNSNNNNSHHHNNNHSNGNNRTTTTVANGNGNGHHDGAHGQGPSGATGRKEYRASISEDDWVHGTVKALSDVEALKKDAEIMTGSDAPPVMTAFALLQSTNRRNILNTGTTTASVTSPNNNNVSSTSLSVGVQHNRTKSAPPPPLRDAPVRAAAVAMAMAPPVQASGLVVSSSSSSSSSMNVSVPLPGSASGSPDHASSSAPTTSVVSPRSHQRSRDMSSTSASAALTTETSSVAVGAGERLLRTLSQSHSHSHATTTSATTIIAH
jgi:hypothetical protein